VIKHLEVQFGNAHNIALALFTGLPCLITCSMQKQGKKAWWINCVTC